MLLNLVGKHIHNIFVTIRNIIVTNRKPLMILIVGKAFIVIVRRLLRFAIIRIDISVEYRRNVDNWYKYEGK